MPAPTHPHASPSGRAGDGLFCPASIRHLERQARRWAGADVDPQDLVQQALLIALEHARRPKGQPASLAWLSGVIRHLARMDHRSQRRRRMRENAFAALRPFRDPRPCDDDHGMRVHVYRGPLPPALLLTARLIACGCTRTELRWLLNLSDAALRKRIGALKMRAWGSQDPPSGENATFPLLIAEHVAIHARSRPVLRARLRQMHRIRPARLGTQDPDGHPLIILTP